jgi:hypothetical protein
MPSYISKNGEWVPANEKVAITLKDGTPSIYSGPDRAAMDYLKEQGVDKLGVHFTKDTEFVNRVRQVHNMSMKEYMDANGYDEKVSIDTFNKNFEKPVLHLKPEKKPMKRQPSGGSNTAGGGSLEGNFGDLSDAKSKIK